MVMCFYKDVAPTALARRQTESHAIRLDEKMGTWFGGRNEIFGKNSHSKIFS